MTQETEHLKVVSVDSPEQADVTLEGDSGHIAELKEVIDLDTLLQSQLTHWEGEIEEIDVEVTPRNGLQGLDN